jgi:hypothetical protein
MTINGMTIAAPFNGGGVSTYILDSVNVDEISVAVAGGLGESDIGGPVMNRPRVPAGTRSAARASSIMRGLVTGRQPDRRAARRRHGETPGIINSDTQAFPHGGPITRPAGSSGAIEASIRHRRSRVS